MGGIKKEKKSVGYELTRTTESVSRKMFNIDIEFIREVLGRLCHSLGSKIRGRGFYNIVFWIFVTSAI